MANIPGKKRERTCRKCGQVYRGRHCKNKQCVNFKNARAAAKRAARNRRSGGRATGQGRLGGGRGGRALNFSGPGGGMNVIAANASACARREAEPTLADLVDDMDIHASLQEMWNAEHPGESPMQSPYAERLTQLLDQIEEALGVEVH